MTGKRYFMEGDAFKNTIIFWTCGTPEKASGGILSKL